MRVRAAARPLHLLERGAVGRTTSGLVYVPVELVETVAGQVAVAARVEAVLSEITAINTELLARRALG